MHIMRTIIIAATVLIAAQGFAQLDPALLKDIKQWRQGERPPARLLKFPEGKIHDIAECELRAIGDAVEDYIAEISDADLLAALIFDPHVEPASFQAAVRRVVRLKGLDHLSRLLADRRKISPRAFVHSDLAVLSQLLRQPYVAIKVARLAPDDMEPDKAEQVFREMKAQLEDGTTWADAYGKFSKMNPDTRARAKDPKSICTLICYLYDGIVSPDGFDILTYSISENLPLDHVRALFPAKRGVSVVRGSDGVYLYQVTDCYDGSANTPSQGMPRPVR